MSELSDDQLALLELVVQYVSNDKPIHASPNLQVAIRAAVQAAVAEIKELRRAKAAALIAKEVHNEPEKEMSETDSAKGKSHERAF